MSLSHRGTASAGCGCSAGGRCKTFTSCSDRNCDLLHKPTTTTILCNGFTACFAGCSSSSEPPVRWIHRRRNVLVSVSLVRPLLPYAWITRQAADVYHSVEVQPTLPDAVRRCVAAPCPKAPPLRDRHSCKVLSCWAVLPVYRGLAPHGSLAGIYVLSA